MSTTIQISDDMQKHLNDLKLFSRETYNDVLERIFEDMQELNERTKKEIAIAIKEIDAGQHKTHEEVGKEMGFQ